MTPKELALIAAKALDEKKGGDIAAIEITEQTTLADYFVICSGTSNTQIKALTESVEEAVMKKLQYEALHRAIQELPLVQRRRLVLYYFQGLTYSQIAELEGCKYQTVQESIYAALKKLKLFLK